MSIVGVDALVTNLFKIAAPVSQALRDVYKDMRLVSDAKEALAIGRRQLADTGYRHRSLHPSFIDRDIHPDNLLALLPLLRQDFAIATERKKVREISEHVELTSSIDNSMLLVGGPVGEGVTRLVFGYEETRYQQGDGLRCSGLGLELPYRWNLDQDGIRSTAKRFVKGGADTYRTAQLGAHKSGWRKAVSYSIA